MQYVVLQEEVAKMMQLPCDMEMSRKSGETKVFTLRRCDESDVDAIVKLQQDVYDALPDKSIFVNTKPEEFLESVKLDYCFCFMDGDEMAAFTLGVSGRVSYRNYGEYLDYDDEHLMKTTSMDTSFVSPKYRGFGLQKFFFELREEAAKEDGCTEAVTTIAPDNEFSLANAYKTGYEVVKTMTIYGGLERCILRKIFE